MTEYTDQIDEAYRKARSGEPRHFAVYVSSDLDVEVLPPDDVNKTGLVKIVENDDEGEVTVFPAKYGRRLTP